MNFFHNKRQFLQQIIFWGFLVIELFFVMHTSILAAPGDLDPSFGKGGKIITFFDFSAARDVALQADGKIVVTGDNSIDFGQIVIARFHTDGTLDASFGDEGKVSTYFGANSYAHGIVIQADRRIVVAGYVCLSNTNCDFAIARFTPDGSLDTSFGGDGKVIIDMGNFNSANDLVIQPDGKIVVVGASGDSDRRNLAFAVARLNSDGSLDASFDGDGRVITSLGSFSYAGAVAVALQTDGKIIVAGHSGRQLFRLPISRLSAITRTARSMLHSTATAK